MRLLDLRLDKFGPFTDHTLDLAEQGVQIIFGPNEAGKSSTLRAITNFLYGFPTRTPDDHVHVQRSLRVGAKVQQSDVGASTDSSTDGGLILYRKKGTKGTLRDESDEIVDEATLANLLRNLPKEQFVTFFGLDSKTLVEGGEDLIRGQGNLGEALFSASMGGQQFQALLKQLDARQNELFKNTGSKPKLNAAFKVLSDAEKQYKEHCLKSTDWEKSHRAVNEATEALALAESLHKDAYLEKERLARIKRTLPTLSLRTDIVSKLKLIAAVRTLPGDSAATRLRATNDINRCQPAIEQLNQDIQRCQSQRETIAVNELVLAQEVAIDALQHQKALYQNNSNEFQLLQREVTEQHSGLEALVANLLPGSELKKPNELILSPVVRQALGELVEEGDAIESSLSEIKAKIQDNDYQLTEAAEMLAGLPESVVIDELQLAIKDAERVLTLEQEVQQFRQQLREQEQATTHLTCQLGLTALREEQMLALSIPSNQKITTLKAASDKCIDERDRQAKKLADLEGEIATLDTQQKQANVSGQLVTENDLTTARQTRENLWREIKSDWIGAAAAVTDKGDKGDKGDKANAYETSNDTADQYADRLRREADQLAEYGLREIQLQQCRHDRAELQAALTDLESQSESCTHAWRALWPAEVESLGSHSEMSDWEQRFRQLQTLITEKAKLKSTLDDNSPRIEGCINFLAGVVAQTFDATGNEIDNANDKAAGNKKSLAFLVDQANSVCAQLLRSKESRLSHETRQNDALKQKTKLSYALQEASQRKDQWLQRWGEQIVVLEVPKESSLSAVKVQLSQFDQLAEGLTEQRKIQAKRDSLQDQITHFEAAVSKLNAACGLVDKNNIEPLNRLHHLVEALTTALDDKRRVQTISATIERDQATLQSESLRLKTAQEQLDGLYQLAGCETTEQLQLIESQNSDRVDLKKTLLNLENTLEAESFTVDELYAEIEGINVDELPLMIDKTLVELDTLDAKKKQAIEDRTTAISEFDGIENQEGAANAAEDAESALAQIDVHYREYCMLAITRQLLSEQIECYRESNQGPVLKMAEAYFNRISLGRYSRLVTQYNDKDEPELYCLRGDNEVPIDGLSEGTRDQLFFSLRLASIVHYLDNNAPIPLIIDDIMMTFDNERSVVAFEILGELAQKTQVLYFTHHAHHKTLAKEALSDGCVFHDLALLAVG
ncbi:MAG: hypothetical protein COB04_19020 [Gammaproteobacteria bacterium]|nr:MAG: hypothetical protein COB04_19020 [Gammaproteobacteria bacterium]